MRIDASQVLGQGGVKIKTGTGTVADALKEGDVVRAGVVSSDKNGNATLKLENGQSFSAKLGVDVKLSPGDTILLEVTGKEKGQLTLSFAGVENAEEDLSAPQMSLVKDFTDKSLTPYASKLAEYNMPVTEESARMMRDLIVQNPKLSLEEAAFLASNKITGDESLMRAALETIAGGDKTDAMIMKLLSLVSEQGTANPTALTGSPQYAPGSVFTVNTANAAPLTELLTTIVKSFANVFDAPVQGETQAAATTQTIIAHSDTVIQTNAEIVDDLLTNGNQEPRGSDSAVISQEPTTPQTPASGQTGTVNPDTPSTQINNPLSGEATQTVQSQPVVEAQTTAVQPQPTTETQTAAQPQPTGETQATAAQPQPTVETQATAAQPQQPQSLPAMSNVVAQVLSDIPEFSNTPQSALQRFSEMLLRVAGDSPEKVSNTEELTAQLEKLFTRIGKDDTDSGTRLRDARQELYTRLALIEEAISRAAQPARTEMLVQTQKLMDHVKLLNSIDQFVYMQMPVQLNEEKKTADLYIFKRKGRKSIDQENVNILLAIDLEFMGHWEALVNIKNNKEVSIQMEVPGEDEKDHFNSHTVLLHNMLDDAGFKLVSTNIKFSKEETTPLTALSAFDRFSGGQQGIIDFKI